MRKIGFFGLLAAVGAVMAIAASSASADIVLCSSATNPCPEGNRYPPTAIKASLQPGTKASFVSGFVSVNCSGSTLENVTTKESGATIPGSFEITSFTGCADQSGNACRMNRYWTGAPYRPATYINGAGQIIAPEGRDGIWINCGPPEEPYYWCLYTVASGHPTTFQLTGGNPATVVANKISLQKAEGSYFLCSGTAVWSGSYNVTSPSPLYVATR